MGLHCIKCQPEVKNVYSFILYGSGRLDQCITLRKMDIKNEYLDIQLWDSYITYSVVIYGYLAVISKIFKCAEINILDDSVEYLDIATEYIK